MEKPLDLRREKSMDDSAVRAALPHWLIAQKRSLVNREDHLLPVK